MSVPIRFFGFFFQMSTMTPKIVMFNMEIGDAPEETADGEEPSHNKLETMIKELSHALSGKFFSLHSIPSKSVHSNCIKGAPEWIFKVRTF